MYIFLNIYISPDRVAEIQRDILESELATAIPLVAEHGLVAIRNYWFLTHTHTYIYTYIHENIYIYTPAHI